MSGTVNTLAAVIRNRLESFINGGKTYKLNSKIEAFINKIISIIPD